MSKQEETHAEEWRDVVGFEGVYSVSNLGRVRRDAPPSRGGGLCKPGRVLKPGADRDGYKYVSLYRNGRGRLFRVHRLVAAAFIGPRPEGRQVDHIDRNPANNTATNLRYVTPSENTAHLRGESHGSTKLAETTVREIRTTYAAGGVSLRELAQRFGISYGHVGQLVRRRNWRHV